MDKNKDLDLQIQKETTILKRLSTMEKNLYIKINERKKQIADLNRQKSLLNATNVIGYVYKKNNNSMLKYIEPRSVTSSGDIRTALAEIISYYETNNYGEINIARISLEVVNLKISKHEYHQSIELSEYDELKNKILQSIK